MMSRPKQAIPKIIYCGTTNRRLAQIAVSAGFLFGCRLPCNLPDDLPPLYFSDQNWRKPQPQLYARGVKRYRPTMATITDIESCVQLPSVIDEAHAISAYVAEIIIIPKCSGVIDKLPNIVNDTRIILGYSVPTRYGGTSIDLIAFRGWPVHLLGGSVLRQISIFRNVRDTEIVSVDCNEHAKTAIYGEYYTRLGQRKQLSRGAGMYQAFASSCASIVYMWHSIDSYQLTLW